MKDRRECKLVAIHFLWVLSITAKESGNVFLPFLRLLVFLGMQDCASVRVDRFVNELILCFLR